MAMFLLIRHAMCDPVGRTIAGRAPGVSLNAQGRQQAEALARRLSGLQIEAVFSSPLERALETARPLAEERGLQVQTLAGLNEIDFGEWTGRALEDLAPAAQWQLFNRYRSGTRIPGGETMLEVVARSVKEFERLQQTHSEGSLMAVVSHGDVLRGLIVHSLGMSLDLMFRLELDPASVSVLDLASQGPRLLLLNGGNEWPSTLPRR
jgi:probable phosphoglycerate mutase